MFGRRKGPVIRASPLIIALVYAAVGVLWIVASGTFVLGRAEDVPQMIELHQWKEVVFVVLTTMMVYWYVRYSLSRLRRSRLQVAQRERYFRELHENSPAAYQSLDRDGRLLDVNFAWLRMLGYDRRADVLGQPFADFIVPEHQPEASSAFLSLRDEGRNRTVEIVLKHRDGSRVTVMVDGRAQLDEDGAFQRTHCVLHDLTARLASEAAERESRRRLDLVLDGARLGTWQWNLETGDVIWNRRQARLYGLDLDEFGGTREEVMRRIHPDDVPRVRELLSSEAPGDQIMELEYRVIWPDGSEHWLAGAGRYSYDANGRPVGVSGITRDIDSRKRAEQDRDRLFRYSVDMLAVAGVDGRFVQVNPAWSAVLGWTGEELAARSWRDIVMESDQHAASLAIADLAAGRPVHDLNTRCRHREGGFRTLSWSMFPFLEDDIIFITAHDMTRREQLQTQLRQAQKMEAVGQLAGGVAHDFNNLLQVISGYSQMALDDLPDDHPAHRLVREIGRAGDRAATLVGQLLTFSRQQSYEPDDLDLNGVIEDLLNLTGRTIGAHIAIDWSPAAESVTVHADRAQVEQMLMNLWINARDAMPRGGTLRIRVGQVQVGEEQSARPGWGPPGRYVRIDVSDSGEGMDTATLERIWDPFFTTKAPGKGTGLGLATVYGVVRQHEGMVDVASRQDAGTTFRVYLPAVDRPASASPARPAITAPGGKETVVVAEDSADVRQLVAAVLGRAGYRVITVDDGSAALAYLAEHGRSVDLALLDVVMPGMSGGEVQRRISEIWPELRVLFMSGYAAEVVHGSFEVGPHGDLLPKPFEAVDLLLRVRAALDRS